MSRDLEQERDAARDALELRIVELLELLVGQATYGERISTLINPQLVTFAANQPKVYEPGGVFASVTVVNPNNFPVYLGYGAADAAPGREIASIPAASWITLPYRGRQLGVGGGNQAGSVHVLAFEIAQPFAAGGLGASWAA